ncbi:MAG: chalcone isomerase family protein [Gammaproteobacteria bacterium]|nr:chalcone isomerase family protein [Gammaproteobacteria bacterium]MBU1775442.1 chalcone isomerase family protein [Gammaproteobacteria bacterium]MBU1969306.1 chalcone isomerase family protein [Gammaproteobacteria bacterium]
MKKSMMMVCVLLLSWNACALEVAGVKLSDTAQVGSANLQLNGAGIRSRLFFKIYVGALYLPQKQASAEVIIADEREHRVALHIVRELSSEKLLNAFNEAIAANHTKEELAALDGQLKQMAQIFNEVKEVKPGDVVALDYMPASGTQISVNGIARGTIAGTEFNRALLRIWLGGKPVQDDLKKAMLGG